MDSLFEKIYHTRQQGQDMVLVTAIEKEGEGPVEVGKKMLVYEDGTSFGTVGGGALELFAQKKAQELFKTRRPVTEKYVLEQGKVVENAKTLPMICGGSVTFFYDFIGVKNHVHLFGAGHVGQALANVLKPLNFHITVIDDRPVILEAFTHADHKVLGPFIEHIDKGGVKPGHYVVVCTPSHRYDYHVLNRLLESKIDVGYMGMLCSPSKLKDYLAKTRDTFGQDINLSGFYSPIGLDIGGGSPEEIAISIAAELLAVHHGRTTIRHMRELLDADDRYW